MSYSLPLLRPPPPSGFENLIGDNFCYFNSVLQMTFRCHGLMCRLSTMYNSQASKELSMGMNADDINLLQRLEHYFDKIEKKKARKGEEIVKDDEPCLLVGNIINKHQPETRSNNIENKFPSDATEEALQALFFKTWAITARRFYENYRGSDNDLLLSSSSITRREGSIVCAKELRLVVAAMENSFSRGSMNDAPEFYEFFMHALAAGVSSFNKERAKARRHEKSSTAVSSFFSWIKVWKAQTSTDSELIDDCETGDISQFYSITLKDSWICQGGKTKEIEYLDGNPHPDQKRNDLQSKRRRSCSLLNKICSVTRNQVIHRVIVYNLLDNFNDHINGNAGVSPLYKSFSDYISDGQILASKESRSCPSCGEPVEVNIECIDLPREQFVMHLLWPSVRPKRSDVTSLMMSIIEDSLLLPRALSMKQEKDSSIYIHPAHLTSILLFKCSHYVAAIRLWDKAASHGETMEENLGDNSDGDNIFKNDIKHKQQKGHWYIIEDDRQPVYIGTEWSALVRHVLIRGFSPLLLGFEIATNVAENRSHIEDLDSQVNTTTLEKYGFGKQKCDKTESSYSRLPVGVNRYIGVRPSARPQFSEDEIQLFLGRKECASNSISRSMNRNSFPHSLPLSLSGVITKYNLSDTQSNSLKTVISVIGSRTYDENDTTSPQIPPVKLESTNDATEFFPYDIYTVLRRFQWSTYERVNWLLNLNAGIPLPSDPSLHTSITPTDCLPARFRGDIYRNPLFTSNRTTNSSESRTNQTPSNNSVSYLNTAKYSYDKSSKVLSSSTPDHRSTSNFVPFNLRKTEYLFSPDPLPSCWGEGHEGRTPSGVMKSPATVKRDRCLDPCKQLPTDLLDKLDNQPISKCLRASYEASTGSVRNGGSCLSTVVIKRDTQTLVGDTFLVLGGTHVETTTTETFIREHGGNLASKRSSTQQYYVLVSVAYLKRRATIAVKKMTAYDVPACVERSKCNERVPIINIFNSVLLECVTKSAMYPILCLEKWISDYITRGTSNVWQINKRKACISHSVHWQDVLTALSTLARQSLSSSYDIDTVVSALLRISQCNISLIL